MIQIVSLAGAVLILVAYGANQTGRMQAEQLPYMLLNLAGATVLAVVALVEAQWGFLLLEGVWALISLYALATRRPGRAPGSA